MQYRQVETQGIKINIPVGSMDKPSAESERIMRDHQDPRGWKYPIRAFFTSDKSLAEDYAYCLDWFVGGHELDIVESAPELGDLYRVTSKGYYHYVGA